VPRSPLAPGEWAATHGPGGTVGPAAPAADEDRGRTFPCERCGADLAFSIGAQQLRCEHCGFEKTLAAGDAAEVRENDLEAGLRRQAERRAAGAAPVGTSELRCGACGATVVFVGTVTSTACAYCGEPLQRDRVHRSPDRIPVDGLLTFAVPAEAARAALRGWVSGRWFAPNEFLQRGVDGVLEGIYLPYFTFDAMTATRYAGERGDHYWVEVGSGNQRRKELRTRWSPAGGAFQRFFDDVLVPAVAALPRSLLEALEPWPLGGVIPFTPAALAGKLAHTYDVELGAASASARQRIDAALDAEVRDRIGGDEQRIHQLQTGYDGLTYKHLLMPVWLLAYRYRGRSYRVAINACTGEVHGERPWSPWKIGFAVVLGLIAAVVAAVLSEGR